MTVSELADRFGTTADTVRYYERIGLLSPALRTAAGYRLFGDVEAERLGFIKRAQRLGLQLQEIRELLAVRDAGLCPCGHAQRLLAAKLGALDEQVRALVELRDEIAKMLADGSQTGDGCWPCGTPAVVDR